MEIWEIFLLGIGLSMDAFAVAVCKGLASEKLSLKSALTVGGWFGFFQALMPLLGFLLASLVAEYIMAVDHWITFILLGLIGGKMIYEAITEDEEADSSVAPKVMLPLALATSIDAMAAGITLAFDSDANILLAIIIIGVLTFILSALGTKIGNVFGAKFQKKAEIFGGIVLILLGFKILIEHLFF